TNGLLDNDLPVYGDGQQVRDWLYVDDHCRGLLVLLENGTVGEAYNIAAGNESTNLTLAETILNQLGKPKSRIRHIGDRQGHDRRYSVDTRKLRNLGWQPEMDFAAAIRSTVRWYVEHQEWWREVRNSDFEAYYDSLYGERLRAAAQARE